MANLINLEQVSKSFGLKTLLDQVSLGVQSGDRIGVVGLNGGGKTTLLEVLTGIEPPDSGRVSHNSDLRMAVVTQRAELNPQDTVADVVLKPLGLETFEWASNAKVREVLGGIGIVDLGLDAKVGQLSGGERQRLMIARALLNSPKIILADEPTGNLDPVTAESIIQIFHSIAASGTAVIMATHNTALVESYPARTLLFSKGEVKEVEFDN
jgi:ABC-type multidrug transport system ATPase subunit